MYYIEASIGGAVRQFHYPKDKHNADAIFRRARDQFSHSRCDWVRICDASGPVRYISHTGQLYF